MFGLDGQIATLDDGHALLLVIVVAVSLGLRHATDPDHLAAVSILMASDERSGARRAGRLGLGWGLGHATSLLACGLPIVLMSAHLPKTVQQAAEVTVGLLIAALALRLLVRWRHGRYHAHVHRHGSTQHRHLHPHATGARHDHDHATEDVLGRSPLQAYAIGMLHGIAGSAGVTLLLLAGIADHGVATLALVLFALATALSMFVLSWGLGYACTRGAVGRRALALTPVMGVVTLAFGLWYALGALDVVGYTL